MPVMRNVMWFEQTHGVSVPTILDWDEKDPLVVKMTFPSQLDTIWEFSRDLMFDVAEDKTPVAGEGDVQFYQAASTVVKMIVLRLKSPYGTIVMGASLFDVRDFVNAVNEERALRDDETTVYASIDRLIESLRKEKEPDEDQ